MLPQSSQRTSLQQITLPDQKTAAAVAYFSIREVTSFKPKMLSYAVFTNSTSQKTLRLQSKDQPSNVQIALYSNNYTKHTNMLFMQSVWCYMAKVLIRIP
jgi:hypothetical protein